MPGRRDFHSYNLVELVEIDELIDPDLYPDEKREVKALIAKKLRDRREIDSARSVAQSGIGAKLRLWLLHK